MNQGPGRTTHRLEVIDRERVILAGVVHVDSFDEREIVLETELGMMAIRGEDLHIKELSLDEANLNVEGLVVSIDYLEGAQALHGKSRGKSFLQRIFG